MKIYWSSEAEAAPGYSVVAGSANALPLVEAAPHAAVGVPLVRVRARAIARFVAASALMYLAWRAAVVWLAGAFDPAATVDVVLDDAYYYLQIAYNLALHGRSTYDGITSTNGYQPAWMALLVGIETVLRLDKKGLFVALQALVFATTAVPLLYCLRRLRDPFYLALAAGLTASFACYPGVFAAGMETVLFAPAFLAICIVARAGFLASAPRASLLFAFVVLIRLDAACLLAAYGLGLGYGWWKTEGLKVACRRVALFALPASLTLAVYALANTLAFGEAVPISGIAKRIGAPILSNWGIVVNYLVFSVPVVCAAVLLLGIELVWTKFDGGRFVYAGMGMLTGALLMHYLFYASFSGWIPWPWYFYVFALMMALLVFRLVEITLLLATQPERKKPLRPQVLALSFVMLAGVVLPAGTHLAVGWQVIENDRRGGVPDGSFNRRNVADAQFFAQNGQPLVVAIGDRAAGLGYWSPDNVQVFPLEGLVSNKAYLQARQHGTGEAWVRETIKPRYLIVDREAIEPVRIDGVERYVVIEPIQGRVVFDHLMTYCFPRDALVRQSQGRDDQIAVLAAPAVRSMFDLAKAEVCTGGFAEHAQRAVFGENSLRHSVVAAEYAPELGGQLNTALERFDRALALRMRDILASRL